MARKGISRSKLKKEIIKCGRDPEYFINNYVKITNNGLVLFNTYDFQDDLLKDFQANRHNVILKARQMGISTLTAAYIAWLTLFHEFKEVLVVATKKSVAANLLRKTKKHIKRLPDWLRISDFETDNRHSFELDNESKVTAASTSCEDAGRSESLSLLVIDEAAFIEGIKEMWKGVNPTLSETQGSSIVISTPNGVGNWFHSVYTKAVSGENDFNPTRIDWWEHPGRDEEWYEKETSNLSEREVAQEYECSFISSGHTVVDSKYLQSLEEDTVEPKVKENYDNNWWIWEKRQEDTKYFITADVARGDGGDYSAFHVFDAEEFKQVSEYKGKIEPEHFAELLIQAGQMYGNCLIVVENNNIGWNVLTKLKESNYPNLFYSEKSTHEQVEQHIAENTRRKGIVPGITTSTKTRPVMISKMGEHIRNNTINIKSDRVLNELTTFIWDNAKPVAMDGYNDDLVMSLAIACWIRDRIIIKGQRDKEYKKAIAKAVSKSDKKFNSSMSGKNKSPMGLGPQVKRNNSKLERKKEEEKKQRQKFKWLYKG